jgi:hypothetical protein
MQNTDHGSKCRYHKGHVTACLARGELGGM